MMFLAQCLLHGNHSVIKSNYLFSLLVWHHFAFQVRMKIGVANSFFKGELDQPSTFAKNVFYLVCSIRKECLCPGASSNVNTIALLLRLQLNDSPPSWTCAHGILNAGVPYLYSQKNAILRESTFWDSYRVFIQHLLIVIHTSSLISANIFQSPLLMAVGLCKYPPRQ